MRVFTITDINAEISTTIPFTGDIALREMYLWPAWYKPKTNVLFSYEKKHQKGLVNNVLIDSGKTYTFEDLQALIRDHLDPTHDNFVNIFHNSGRVTMMIKNDDKFTIHKIKFCDELLEALNIVKRDVYIGVITGNPIALADIRLTLSNTNLLMLKCHEVDEVQQFTNSQNSNTIAIVPLEFSDDKLIRFKDDKPLFYPLDSTRTIHSLHFSIEDQYGNQLPLHKVVFSLLNKQ